MPHGRLRDDPTAWLTLGLAIVLALVFAADGLIYLTAPTGLEENALGHAWDTLHGRGSDDSWGAMQAALNYFQQPQTAPLYSEVFFTRQYRFQYPPSALFALSGMLALGGPLRVRVNEVQTFDAVPLNDLIGWVFILATIAATAALLEQQLSRRHPHRSRVLIVVRVLLVAALTLTFYPIVKAYTLGQIQVWINAMFAIALLCWALDRKVASGVLLGVVCLMKPHYALFLGWAALRGEWRFAIACGITGGVGLAAAVLVYGLENHIDYLRVLSFLSQHGETFYPNHSINGLLNRVMSLWDPVQYKNLEFMPGQFPPFNAWIYAATLTSSIAILGAAVLHRSNRGDPQRLVDFSLMALSCTMASPIAWEHHYGVLLPIFALLAIMLAEAKLRWIAILAFAYVLASVYMPATKQLAATPYNFLQSYLLLSALIVLALLHWRPWAKPAAA